jgi:CheY-like chemotaxis protein
VIVAAKQKRTTGAPPPKKTVLCIDDQPEGLAIRKIFLETFGYEVLLAQSGREGLKLLENNTIDALVLDYRMPEMDGAAVALEVRKKWPKLPIVMLSGYVAEIPSHVHNLVSAFVSKGSPPSELLETLRNVGGTVPKKPPVGFSNYDLIRQLTQEHIERSRMLVAKNRERLNDQEKERQG